MLELEYDGVPGFRLDQGRLSALPVRAHGLDEELHGDSSFMDRVSRPCGAMRHGVRVSNALRHTRHMPAIVPMYETHPTLIEAR